MRGGWDRKTGVFEVSDQDERHDGATDGASMTHTIRRTDLNALQAYEWALYVAASAVAVADIRRDPDAAAQAREAYERAKADWNAVSYRTGMDGVKPGDVVYIVEDVPGKPSLLSRFKAWCVGE
jgi:hypothetical protein